MAVRSGHGAVWRRLLPVLFNGLAMMLILGAVSGPGWRVTPATISIETSKPPEDASKLYKPDMDVHPVLVQVGLFSVCTPNVTTTGKGAKLRGDDVEQVCAEDYPDAYDKFLVDPEKVKGRPTWTLEDDSMRGGAQSMAIVAVVAGVTSVALRALHFLNWFKSCPMLLRPGATVTLSDIVGMSSAFGVTGVLGLSPVITAKSAVSWLTVSYLTAAKASNSIVIQTEAPNWGPSYYACNLAGILFALNVVDGLWGLHSPQKKAKKKKQQQQDDDDDED